MEWIIIEGFLESIDKHMNLFKALVQEKSFFLVRKEWIEFEELEEKDRNDIIEENYDLFKNGLLYFETEDLKKSIIYDIFEIIKEVEEISTNISVENVKNILEFLEEKTYTEYLNKIKNLIMFEILRQKKSASYLNSCTCKTTKNMSHKFLYSKGILESECKYFEWYKIDSINELKKFVEDNFFNYNICITTNNSIESEYKYYINYYEDEKCIMAVKDYNGDFLSIFKKLFKNKYKLN